MQREIAVPADIALLRLSCLNGWIEWTVNVAVGYERTSSTSAPSMLAFHLTLRVGIGRSL